MKAALNSGLLRRLGRQYFLFSLLLLILGVIVNASLQANFFKPIALVGLLRTYLPLVLLAAGQTIVIIGGGIDLSVGSVVSMVNVILVTRMGAEATQSQVLMAVALGLLAGTLAGALNGACIAFLRFQPLVTTFATSSIFAGIAVWILPRPGGSVPESFMQPYRSAPLGVTFPLWVILGVALIWWYLRSTRFGRYLYATGGDAYAAYMSAVPVEWVRFFSYVASGLMAALSGLLLTMSIGTGSALIGLDMTMPSIVSVVLGGTALSGGGGGVIGTILGVFILAIIRNIISFANVPSWWQTLVNGLAVMLILAGPGIWALIRGRREA